MDTLLKYLCGLTLIWCAGVCTIRAQTSGMQWDKLKNVRSDRFQADSNIVQLDTSGILPATFILKDAETDSILPAGSYFLDGFSGKLRILDTALYGKTMQATYRVLPYRIASVYRKKNFHGYTWRDSTYLDPYFYDPNYTLNENPIDFGGLNYNGAFARGITFGNNQDLVVNSTLDLQLSGKIGDLEILAALTDNNIPIQPDGSTQQLQEFDKVYIQVTKGNRHQFVAGDYGIKSRDGYFIRFDKQLQGASFKTRLDFKKGWATQHSFSFAVAKGKYARNTFNGQEGNQGPYKLVGNNGETYIVILAGSERVFADGRLLQRGENNDYTMDYNTGEVIFTPRFLVTKDIRLVVEFEYSDRNYFRSLIHSGHSATYKGLTLYAEFYSEQDSRNRPILADIDSTAENIMRSIGNNINQAIVPGIRQAEYVANSVQYAMKDTVINGIRYDSIFYYTTASDLQLYNLSFSYVGEGRGRYMLDKNTLNQRVYSWTAPVGDALQGAYEPVVLLITPKKDRYAVLGMNYKIDPKTQLRTELSYSNRDVNTFSSEGNPDNIGWAVMNNLQRQDTVGKNKWVLSSRGMYEVKSTNFQAPEQYRPVEFSRDWNQLNTDRAMEHFANGSFSVYSSEHQFRLGGGLSFFNRQDKFTGYKQQYDISFQKNNWDIRGEVSWLNSTDSLNQSSFLRPKLHIGRTFEKLKGFQIALEGFTEYNAIRNQESDTLISSAYYNNNLYATIKTADTAAFTSALQYKYRTDFFPQGSDFVKLTKGHDLDISTRANKLKDQNLSVGFTFRTLEVKDSVRTGQSSDQNFLGRAEYGFRIKRGAIRFNALYELGSGQERVREFTYLEVAPGQGLYRWIDVNGDGVQQLDEFVIAQFSDSANYTRVLTNVNEYIQARIVTYNQVIQLNPKAVWFNEKGLKKLVARFSLNSSIVITRKTFKGASVSPFNPFILNTNDENVLNMNSAFRNSVFFNQGSPKFYLNYTWFFNQNKTLLVNGFDTRKKYEQTVETNVNLVKSLSFNVKASKIRDLADAEYSGDNNFDLGIYRFIPSLSWLLKTVLRTTLGYEFENKRNIPELGNELARANKLNFDIRYSIVSKQTIEAKFSFVLFDYNGVTGTPKSYQILDGLQPGKNYIWNLSFNRNLSNNLQLNLTYEGRKTGEAGRLIHTGNASLRALF